MSSSTTTTTTTTTNTYLKTDYLQPSYSTSSSSISYDSSQSPLALLAQTCSSIGKDCPSPPSSSSSSSSSSISTSTPAIITSLVTKSSSNPSSTSNSDKSNLLSNKRTLSSQLNSSQSNRKSTLPLKSTPINKSSSFVDSSSLFSSHFPPIYDPTTAALLLRSSLTYLAVQQQQQQHSYTSACTVPGCLQCETVRHILAASALNSAPSVYPCHWYSCNRRFSSNEDLFEHIQHHHRSSLKSSSNSTRFHPYLKPSMMINNNDQLPFFYPHLSLSPMTGSTRRMNNNTDNNN